MRKSSFANSKTQTNTQTHSIAYALPNKVDRFPNQTQSMRGKNALFQTASLREFLGTKLPRKEAPVGLLTAIKEKIKSNTTK